jgi:hypothetical protein
VKVYLQPLDSFRYMHPTSRDSGKCDEHGIRRMSIIVAIDAHVRLCMQIRMQMLTMHAHGWRCWSNKTRMDTQNEHGVQPAGL